MASPSCTCPTVSIFSEVTKCAWNSLGSHALCQDVISWCLVLTAYTEITDGEWVDPTSKSPNNMYGFGLVDMSKVLKFDGNQTHELFFKDRAPMVEGQMVERCFSVQNSQVDFIATLVKFVDFSYVRSDCPFPCYCWCLSSTSGSLPRFPPVFRLGMTQRLIHKVYMVSLFLSLSLSLKSPLMHFSFRMQGSNMPFRHAALLTKLRINLACRRFKVSSKRLGLDSCYGRRVISLWE